MKKGTKISTKKKLNKAGYTLVELIVVVAIIAIFTGMSAIGLSVVRNRHVTKYAKMVNELISDFYKNATTKESNWKLEIQLVDDSKNIYRFAQYYETEENGVKVWKEYYTQSIDGTTVYAVKEIEIDCDCDFYLDSTQYTRNNMKIPKRIFVSREHAVFDKSTSHINRIVFKNGAVSEEVNVVLGTPNSYVGPKKS